jgi:uncharacterized membrane protein YedE/YeeE
MMGRVLSLVSGLIFAFGLALSGMTQPAKISGFLDFFGRWDPSLAFVMGGAVVVYVVGHRLALRRGKPLFADALPDRPPARVDRSLIAGAIIFGVGWGMSGYCPAPAIVSVGAGASAALWFVPAMVAGMIAHLLFERFAGGR